MVSPWSPMSVPCTAEILCALVVRRREGSTILKPYVLTDRSTLGESRSWNPLVSATAPLFWAEIAQLSARAFWWPSLTLIRTMFNDAPSPGAGATRIMERCGIAFTIGMNRWKGETRLQLELCLRQHSESLIGGGDHRYNVRRVSETGAVRR